MAFQYILYKGVLQTSSDVAMAIIKHPKWKLALRNTSSTVWGRVTTPLRQLIKKMPSKFTQQLY